MEREENVDTAIGSLGGFQVMCPGSNSGSMHTLEWVRGDNISYLRCTFEGCSHNGRFFKYPVIPVELEIVPLDNVEPIAKLRAKGGR